MTISKIDPAGLDVGQIGGRRNLIINGAMQVAQRGTSAFTANDGTYGLDRFVAIATANGKFTMQQNSGSVTPPVGFTNYLGCVSTAATSVGAGDFWQVRHKIEGFNSSILGWGASGALSASLSFWVRSSLTGTFGGSITNSAGNRTYSFGYTINSADTWEYKTVSIDPTTTGTWLTGNSNGLQLGFSLGSGSTYQGTAGAWSDTFEATVSGAVDVVATNGATWYITGVQLEVGTVATPFEHRSYGEELALCQRYCQVFYDSDDVTNFYAVEAGSSGFYHITQFLPVFMRAAPTSTINGSVFGTIDTARHNTHSLHFNWSSLNGNYGYIYNDTAPYKLFTLDAEL